ADPARTTDCASIAVPPADRAGIESRARPARARPNTRTPTGMTPMHQLRILILYPNPEGLALLASMLKSPGYIVEEAVNDRMAVRLLERETIDLVLAGGDPGGAQGPGVPAYRRRGRCGRPGVR